MPAALRRCVWCSARLSRVYPDRCRRRKPKSWADAEFLVRFENKGTKITLKENDAVTSDAPLLKVGETPYNSQTVGPYTDRSASNMYGGKPAEQADEIRNCRFGGFRHSWLDS